MRGGGLQLDLYSVRRVERHQEEHWEGREKNLISIYTYIYKQEQILVHIGVITW